ncbi:MAG: bifunctional hydroxymethylpyrimidine kinase/phosphomethylpyrimidine kinase [Acidobacteria bacterium]|nr:MAG: bifunctional hydroxymethylpyrimidine kinase/phosphomethylpyrimidine kinase [Acidobacteriota bacterium]
MNHHSNPPATVVLTIAGFDPSGGAGILADLKTFAAHNCYGVAAITALTVQNTQSVSSVHATNAKVLKETILSLVADGHLRAVKIGMLANRENAEVVREILQANPSLPAVLDPVWRSATGADLLNKAGLEYLRDHLLRHATLITPNLAEASALTDLKVENQESMKAAAQKLAEMGARAVVVTGGHLEKAVDVFYDGKAMEVFVGDHIKPDNTHGTGWTFSAAVASNLALGRQLRDSIVLAKAYVTEAIRKAYAVGPGRVPLNHFYRVQQNPRPADLSPPVQEPEAVH